MSTFKERVLQFDTLQMPGQPQGMHMGTSYLVHDLLVAAERVSGLFAALGEWSDQTFGAPPGRGPQGPLKHLAKEAEEALAKPGDVLEYADCLMLVMDAARRAGFTLDELLDAWAKKLDIVSRRVYPAPTSADEPVEHVREPIPVTCGRCQGEGSRGMDSCNTCERTGSVFRVPQGKVVHIFPNTEDGYEKAKEMLSGEP